MHSMKRVKEKAKVKKEWSQGAPKFCFTKYLYVTIILFSTGFYKSLFSAHSFVKLGFCLFSVLNSISSL